MTQKISDISNISIFNQTTLDVPLPIEEAEEVVGVICKHEACSFKLVEAVYVDEAGIIDINRKYLQRDYVTDIISFNYSDNQDNQEVEGTLFCCVPRIYEQAGEFNQELKTEFFRIFIHGLLHLIGYEDQTKEQQLVMRAKENFYLEQMSLPYE